VSTIERLKVLYKERHMEHMDIEIWDAAIEKAWPKLLAVVEAAEAVLDEADPRKYGDMTAKQSDLADKLIALHENSASELQMGNMETAAQ